MRGREVRYNDGPNSRDCAACAFADISACPPRLRGSSRYAPLPLHGEPCPVGSNVVVPGDQLALVTLLLNIAVILTGSTRSTKYPWCRWGSSSAG